MGPRRLTHQLATIDRAKANGESGPHTAWSKRPNTGQQADKHRYQWVRLNTSAYYLNWRRAPKESDVGLNPGRTGHGRVHRALRRNGPNSQQPTTGERNQLTTWARTHFTDNWDPPVGAGHSVCSSAVLQWAILFVFWFTSQNSNSFIFLVCCPNDFIFFLIS